MIVICGGVTLPSTPRAGYVDFKLTCRFNKHLQLLAAMKRGCRCETPRLHRLFRCG